MQKMISFGFLFFVAALLTQSSCQSKSGASDTSEQSANVINPAALGMSENYNIAQSASALYLTIVKNQSVPVSASFNIKDGLLNLDEGALFGLKLIIDIVSFDSGLTLRNENVRHLLFNTEVPENGTAIFTVAHLPRDAVNKLKTDKKIQNIPVNGELYFRNQKRTVPVTINASFNEKGWLVIKSASPSKIRISEWGLSDNLASLIQVCQHQNVDDAVNVDFHLEFQQQ